ncbi:MATE family efflux transporter [Rhodopseudomonas boonkerdii]|uniref:MATE family efflux transporter n=1 Tax=Rhodopseudomonas boonkerdii TaxID=475937 RepID=UPI001E627828|nr:MATE family efflux transporter [Rhodopseudomonas boonkerdii]UGV24413.1 MATE family efflux transporter [Rhodopseudomonas boonkerdii]
MPAEKPLWQAFLIFVGPMMVSNILQSLFGTINNIYLGQLIGVNALAAASAAFPLMFFFIAFVIGLGAGAGILIGQAWGAGQRDKVKEIAAAALLATLVIGLIVSVFGGLFARPLMIALATPANILDQATDYARIMMLSMPLTFVFLLSTSLLRGVGDTVTPLLGLAISTMLGLILTPALILGWTGLPPLGVVSAAIASALSTAVGMTWFVIHLIRRNHPLAPDAAMLRHLHVDLSLLGRILRLGIPTAIQIVTMSLAELALLGIVNGFGSDATAAYGAVNQVIGYAQFPAISIAISASVFGAQAIGRGDVARLGAIVRTALLLNFVLTGGLVALIYLFSRTVMGFFITDTAVLDLSQHLLHIVLWSSIVFGMAGIFSGTMRASGTVFVPTLLSVLAIALIEVPSAIVLSRHFGVTGVWYAWPITFCAMLLLQASYYRFVWRKKTITRLI